MSDTDKIARTRAIMRRADTATLRASLAGYERLAVRYPGEPVERLLAVFREELATRAERKTTDAP